MSIRKAPSTKDLKKTPEVAPEAAIVAPESAPASEATVTPVEPEVVVAPPAAEVPQEVNPNEITVMAAGADQYEPFQRIALPQSVPVTLENTNWVQEQLKAKVLVRV